jgi:hypothetical protein
MLSSGVLLAILGMATISRFSPGVRNVAIVGLTGGGFAVGMGLTILLSSFLGREPQADPGPR